MITPGMLLRTIGEMNNFKIKNSDDIYDRFTEISKYIVQLRKSEISQEKLIDVISKARKKSEVIVREKIVSDLLTDVRKGELDVRSSSILFSLDIKHKFGTIDPVYVVSLETVEFLI